MTAAAPRAVVGVAGLALVVLVSACSGVGERADQLQPDAVGDDQVTVTASFDDALNLPAGAAVKLDGVRVGKVVGIDAVDYRAQVVMAIDEDAGVPVGSAYRLRSTTALGEVYVEVTPAPAGGAPLAGGAVVPADATSVAATVEDALASASLLVNGGNLGQIQTIVSELGTALDGRTGAARQVLAQTDAFLAEILASTREIDRTLTALAGASATLDAREETIDAALAELRPAAATLTDSTDDLAALLDSADALALTADDLVRSSRDDLELIVDEVGPVLDTLLAAEDELLPALSDLTTFGATIDDRVAGDYLGGYLRLGVTDALRSPLPTPTDLLGGSTPAGG